MGQHEHACHGRRRGHEAERSRARAPQGTMLLPGWTAAAPLRAPAVQGVPALEWPALGQGQRRQSSVVWGLPSRGRPGQQLEGCRGH